MTENDQNNLISFMESAEYKKCLKHMAERIVKHQEEIKVLKETLLGRDKYIDLLMESYEKRIDNDRE